MSHVATKCLRVLITGASSGVGAATAQRFAAAGSNKLYLFGRNKERLENVAKQVESYDSKSKAWIFTGDVSNHDSVQQLVKKAHQDMGGIDVVVANAGSGKKGMIDEVSEDLYDQTMNTNVKGVYLTLHHTIPIMKAQKSGQIVVTSSVRGFRPAGGSSIYCASKYAVEGMVACVRQELAGSGVKIALVNPAAINTPWWNELGKTKEELARMLSPHDVANAIYFLGAEQSPTMDTERIVMDPPTAASL